MILCIDAQYDQTWASIAALSFQHWEDAKPQHIYTQMLAEVSDYEPGQFYRRELPGILEVLKKIPTRPEIIIVDGYVFLSDEPKLGLGGYLYEALDAKIPVIGVAKNKYKDFSQCEKLLRGDSKKPLYITSIGLKPAQAVEYISRMHGNYRMPTMLKLVDSWAREEMKNWRESSDK